MSPPEPPGGSEHVRTRPVVPSGVVAAASADQWSESDPWTVLRLILWSADYLTGKGVPSARLDAEHLLAHVLGVGRLQLYLEFERPLTPPELDAFRPLLKRRAAREPLQYVIGRQPFRTLDLEVGPGALIPRPETEQLVEGVLDWLRVHAAASPRVLDVGTGTGAIALSLAAESEARVTAVEVSGDAVRIARSNLEQTGLADRVELLEGSLFEPLAVDALFDVVVSNPPYVAEVDEETLEPEVRVWEPRTALFGGRDGLDVIRDLVAGAARHLREGGLLAVEVGAGQAQAVAALVEGSGQYHSARVGRDHSGIERFVFAQADTDNGRAPTRSVAPTGDV